MMPPIRTPWPAVLGGDGPMPAPSDRVEILLVEDNSDDADLMVKALQKCELNPHVTVVEDGEEAIHYLYRQGAFGGAARPDLILLDLHLPRKSGHEVLAEIKEDDRLRRIPVIIMTSSEDERSFQTAYDLYANCCVCKPGDLDEFADTVNKIEDFWLRVASRLRGQ
jgi:two-component system, chemotaxis family, response regulator Rcp1